MAEKTEEIEVIDPRTSHEVIFVGIIKAVGGKLIIHKLPFNPPIDCSFKDCEEFADYSMLIVEDGSNETPISYPCETHMQRIIELQEAEIPVIITH